MIEPSLLLQLWKGEKSFGRTIWDSASQGKFKTFFLLEMFSWGILACVSAYLALEFPAVMQICGGIAGADLRHKSHILFLALEEVLRLGQTDAGSISSVTKSFQDESSE